MLKLLDSNSRSVPFNIILLILVCFLIFIVPLFSGPINNTLSSTGITLIFFSAVLALEKNRRKLLTMAVMASVTEWLAGLLGMRYLENFSSTFNFLFFSYVVFALIMQVAKSQAVRFKEIVESITGYLMLGLLYSVILLFIYRNFPSSINFSTAPETFGDFIYFGFVTLTTLGYGDINPVLPVARSAAILISVSGQLYVATIIAIIVSKYSGAQKPKS